MEIIKPRLYFPGHALSETIIPDRSTIAVLTPHLHEIFGPWQRVVQDENFEICRLLDDSESVKSTRANFHDNIP